MTQPDNSRGMGMAVYRWATGKGNRAPTGSIARVASLAAVVLLGMLGLTGCSSGALSSGDQETGALAGAGAGAGAGVGAGGAVADANRPVRSYTLTAAPAVVSLHERVSDLEVWAYNGQIPGPVLWARQGYPFEVTLTNQLPQPTTIHWHGVRVPNAMDGVPGVTQPPVQIGDSFRYAYVPQDAGTFWFHPHVRGSEQVERGLQGVLIVEDNRDIPWSQDLVWVLDDWLLDANDGQIVDEFNTPGELAHDGRWGNFITVNGRKRPTYSVSPGERIRLRMVVTANGRVFSLKLGELLPHAQAIAIDGMYAGAPFDPTGFYLAPGNRMDLDIRIPADAGGSVYAIRDAISGGETGNVLARLAVRDVPAVPTPDFPTLAQATFPQWPRAAEGEPNITYRLNAKRGGEYGISWTINGDTYGDHQVATFEEQEWVKVRFKNESFRLHPMHMHGVFFRVLARDGEPDLENHWRDTVLVLPQQTVDIALVPGERGKWALHCHILEHAEAGMMTVFEVVAPGEKPTEGEVDGGDGNGEGTVGRDASSDSESDSGPGSGSDSERDFGPTS